MTKDEGRNLNPPNPTPPPIPTSAVPINDSLHQTRDNLLYARERLATIRSYVRSEDPKMSPEEGPTPTPRGLRDLSTDIHVLVSEINELLDVILNEVMG